MTEKDKKELNEKIDERFDVLERLLFIYVIGLTALITAFGFVILLLST